MWHREGGLGMLLLFSELLSEFFKFLFVASLIGVERSMLFFGSIVSFFLLMQKVLADDDFEVLHGPTLELFL
jgi:hypothetical protein